jgi:hypothetical protein
VVPSVRAAISNLVIVILFMISNSA